MSKQKLWIVFPLLFAMVLAACGGGAAQETPMVEPTTDTAAQPTEEMAEPTATTEEMAEPTATTEGGEGGDLAGGTVSVLAVWGGDEQDSFEAMIAPFEEETGIDVQYEGTRDLNAVLTSRVEGGNPPDLAGLPGPGQLQEYARNGSLVNLSEVLDMDALGSEYDQGFLDLASADGNLYGIFIKAAVKSLIWYSPPAFEAAGYTVPTTWEELQALEQQIIADGGVPWCIGLESGAASGWPGTDWIEDIMLRTAGPDLYDQWWQHEIPWTDESVRTAWETFGSVINESAKVYGGAQGVLSTNFGQSPFPMFEEQPGCYLHRQASFITSFITEQYPDLVAGEDYDFFPFPPIGDSEAPLLVAGDLFGMFNDTPEARALMEYLVTAEAQSIWAERGGFLSANRTVDPATYPDQLTQQIGQMLVDAPAVRFDASDLMPEAVNNAFWTGILDFVSAPDNLDSILENIESVATDAYQTSE